MAVEHEALDVRVWDQDYSRWWQLAPFRRLDLEHREDLSVDTLTVTVSDNHKVVPVLRNHRTTPVPVTVTLNGWVWSGLVSQLRQTSGGEVTVSVAEDTKHLQRMLARSRASVAVDSDATEISGRVGRVLADLAATGAQRTGLPLYLNVQDEGDNGTYEVKADDTVASVVEEALAASTTYVSVRMLLPGMKVPEGRVVRVQGAVEGTWEADRISRGAWPVATHNGLVRTAVKPATTPTPHLSWIGKGTISDNGTATGEMEGVCWVPFIMADTDRGYWQDESVKVRVATRAQLNSDRRTGWDEHVTYWYQGTFGKREDTDLLDKTARAGQVVKTNGAKLESKAAAESYIGAGAAYAWFTGSVWVLANTTDYQVENTARQAKANTRITPGLLVQTRTERDRKHIVFSSTPGGGLESWETTTSSPEAAMIHASTQLDEATLKAITSGSLTAGTVIGEVPPGSAGAVIGSANGVAETVDTLDVSAQPFATISGTDVSYSRVGAKVNVNAAGPFFYREMPLSLSSSGANPVGEMGREWARSQGSTSISLTPGFVRHTVFGDDVPHERRVIPGWLPGDRISFVDGQTRISEVVSGVRIEKDWDGPLKVTPLLGRQDNGVADAVMGRIRKADSRARRALQLAPRRIPQLTFDRRVEGNTVIDTRAQRYAATAETNATAAGQAAAEQAIKSADASSLARSKALVEAFAGYGVRPDQMESAVRSAKERLKSDAARAAELSTDELFTVLAGGGDSLYRLQRQLDEVNRSNSAAGLSARSDILSAYVAANNKTWDWQRSVNQRLEEQDRTIKRQSMGMATFGGDQGDFGFVTTAGAVNVATWQLSALGMEIRNVSGEILSVVVVGTNKFKELGFEEATLISNRQPAKFTQFNKFTSGVILASSA